MLTPETTVELLELCKEDKCPPMNKWGSLPMNGQLSCEGPMGRPALDTIVGPGYEMVEREKLVDPATVKAHMQY